MKCSVEHESLSLITVMFCERDKAKVLRIIIQQNDKPTNGYLEPPIEEMQQIPEVPESLTAHIITTERMMAKKLNQTLLDHPVPS